MRDGAPTLEARALVREYDGERAVDEIDLRVEAGEIHAIVGLNGAGKTTLMRLLLGMIRPTAGVALIAGVAPAVATPDVWRRVGSLIETPFAYPELTVRENVIAAAVLHGLERDDVDARVDTVIEGFSLGRWENRRSRVLSLGNRQRLGLAAALVHRPDIVVLDEPANALDPAGVVFIRDLMRDLAGDGAAILVSSHHLDQVARVADRITLLHRGRVVGDLDPRGVELERQFFERILEVDVQEGRV